ncbi:MAG: hypothetical protein N2746_04690 [Deltaproteobacteria bacterium]|nr:hypothetical protein [Deltaproteobacteria bacterium]
MNSKFYILLLFFAILFSSCAGVGYNSSKLETLHSIINRETQKTSIYDGLQSRAFFKVVYRSMELRRSYVDTITEMESLTESEKSVLLEKEIEDERKYFEFLVILSTTEFKANDLNVKKSLWRVFLEDGHGYRNYPIEIKEIKADQKIKILYPGISRFAKFYSIRFEKGEKREIKGMNLVFSSALGKAVFKY